MDSVRSIEFKGKRENNVKNEYNRVLLNEIMFFRLHF